MSRPRDPWALITRTVLALGMGYMTWKLQTIEGDIAKLQQDVAFMSGSISLARGGRIDR